MWLIRNSQNIPVLTRYYEIIKIFFDFLVEVSEIDSIIDKIENRDYLDKALDAHDVLSSKLLTIKRNSNDTFKSLLIEIIKLGHQILKNEYQVFVNQNNELIRHNLNIPIHNPPQPLKRLFKDYFYDDFFGKKWIWTDFVGTEYDREQFKTNFKNDNKLFICSYCDIDTIASTRNAWIEHFLPKGKYPYISCNPNNLIPSCTSCNVSGSGKGENTINPVTNQYQVELGDKLIFNFQNGEIQIEKNNDESIENFIELLKLRNRYQEDSTKENILSTLKTNYETISVLKRNGEFAEDEFHEFIHQIGRNRGYYFVQKGLLKHIDEI